MTDSRDPEPASRAVATLETVTAISRIEGADRIAVARIRGWDVVVRVGEFMPGDTCVYLEVDTLIDVTDVRFAFLASRGVRKDEDGFAGHVLKTAKLRGQYSQGLALPAGLFPELDGLLPGSDVTGFLPVRRWDPPVPAQLRGKAIGGRPRWIPATDEVRIENTAMLLDARSFDWVATEKVDGTSTTVYSQPGSSGEAGAPARRGVCSRNYDLEFDRGHAQWALALELGLHDLMEQEWPGSHVAVQGETFGPGVQGNPLGVKTVQLALFTVRVDGVELPRNDWPGWAAALAVPEMNGLAFPSSTREAVEQVDGLESLISPGRLAEGVVWRARDTASIGLLPGDADAVVGSQAAGAAPGVGSDGADVVPDAAAVVRVPESGTAESGVPDVRAVRASFKVVSRNYLLAHDR